MQTPPPTRTITVFGSGSECLSAEDYEQARQLGAELARRGFTLRHRRYGGTRGAAAPGARRPGGVGRKGWGSEAMIAGGKRPPMEAGESEKER